MRHFFFASFVAVSFAASPAGAVTVTTPFSGDGGLGWFNGWITYDTDASLVRGGLGDETTGMRLDYHDPSAVLHMTVGEIEIQSNGGLFITWIEHEFTSIDRFDGIVALSVLPPIVTGSNAEPSTLEIRMGFFSYGFDPSLSLPNRLPTEYFYTEAPRLDSSIPYSRITAPGGAGGLLATPEPSTALLLGLGIVGLGLSRRIRSHH